MNLSWVKEAGLEEGMKKGREEGLEEGEDLLKNVILFLKNNQQATYEEVREKFDCKIRTYETARELSNL